MNTADSPASKVAFVFEGGGSLAATQIGMLRALTEARLRPATGHRFLRRRDQRGGIRCGSHRRGSTGATTMWLWLHRSDLLRR